MATWLRCRVLPLSLGDEHVVAVDVRGFGEQMFIVAKQHVEADRVRVTTFGDRHSRWAVLPAPFEETISVNSWDLVDGPALISESPAPVGTV